MDPLTAVLNAISSTNNFLCTPAGQKIALDQSAIFEKIFDKLGVHLANNTTPNAPAADPK